MSQTPYSSPSATTDIPAFLQDLTAGLFEQQLSIALSRTAARVVDHKPGKGRVTITLDFEGIDNTQQVRIEHKISFTHPTALGKASEETQGADVMFVGKGGALTLAQPSLLDRQQNSLDLG